VTVAPLLVLAVGNPSRGDDALGPCFVERAAAALAGEVAAGQLELLTDFQLQIEHALDLSGRQRVVFVDASVGATPPFEFTRIEARRDPSASSHAMSPAAVLQTHRDVFGEPPEAWVLAIRGERFELGEGLSASAAAHLDAALAFFERAARGQLGATERR
jgi:hydrogenase maturation protease